jgi:hypothetical protein
LSIKAVLQDVARNGDVAILVSHHPTKDVMRKKEVLTTVAGSGLSATQANSRYSLFIDTVENKGKRSTKISHLKHNNVDQEDVLSHKQVYWDSSSLIFIDNVMLKAFKSKSITIPINDSYIGKAELVDPVKELIPNSIDLDEVFSSVESVSMKEERSAVDNNTLDEYSLFLAQQGK